MRHKQKWFAGVAALAIFILGVVSLQAQQLTVEPEEELQDLTLQHVWALQDVDVPETQKALRLYVGGVMAGFYAGFETAEHPGRCIEGYLPVSAVEEFLQATQNLDLDTLGITAETKASRVIIHLLNGYHAC